MAIPRYLTLDEIERIANSIPKIVSTPPEIGEYSRQGIMQTLRLQLYDEKITPDGIDELIKKISNNMNRSYIHPGDPIGITTAEATNQPTTQATLNTFH